MTNATVTTVATIAAVASEGAAVAAETIAVPAVQAAPKTPSKKSLAVAIFAAKMAERTQGLYASNKEFRSAVLRAIETELGVSTASAATMYNSCKVDAETADANVGLGRDPKVIKVKTEGSGKRGRPQGSKNKAAEVVVVTDATAAVVEAADATAAVTAEGDGYAAPAAEAATA